MTDGAPAVTGLGSAEAAELLARFGPNRMPRPRQRSLAARVLAQLRDPMILLLLVALVVVVALGDVADGSIIAAVIVANTVIGVQQEVRAAAAIAALDELATPTAVVVRDGGFQRVESPEVVPGDVLRLEAGDIVAADAEIVEGAGLRMDESAVTGESVPVPRVVGDPVLSGTVVTLGRALATVTATGPSSAMGRIAAGVVDTGVRPTPLQQRLTRLSRQLVIVTLVASWVIFALALVRGEDAVDALILAVSLAIAAVPESLPAVVSVALALGAYRMARRSAVVRWLPAVETLGSVTVLATDKTGTITEGAMVAQRLWTPSGEWEVEGQGYLTSGSVVARPGAADDGSVDLLLRDAVLCNDARLTGTDAGAWQFVGDPMEAALLIAAAKRGDVVRGLTGGWERVGEVPFDAAQRRMTSVHRRDGSWLVVCKGAPEVVTGLAAGSGGPDVETVRAAAADLAGRGFRVLAVADATYEHPPGPEESASGLVLRGLVAVADPPRPGAADVVRACAAAGIRTVMVTGDHAATARAIADEVGIRDGAPEVLDGDALDRGEHLDQVERVGVYARIRPEQKVDIVAAWQARGDVVAMTGDGVNDAPALRRADIGVAMGDRGTEVARQAADLVLADDDLGTVVVAVGEGRRIYENIRSFLRYGVSGGFAALAVIALGPFVGLAMPLGPGQILWINLMTHGLPGVAFGGEPMDPAVLERPSPSPQESVLGGGLLRQIIVAGALIALVSLAAGVLAPDATEQTAVFLALGLSQLGVALALRASRRGLSWRSRGLEACVAVAAALQVAAATWSPLQRLLDTETVSLPTAGIVVLLSVVPGLVVAATRRRERAHPPGRAGSGAPQPGSGTDHTRRVPLPG